MASGQGRGQSGGRRFISRSTKRTLRESLRSKMALKRAWGVESSCDSCFRFCPDLLIHYFHLQSPLPALSSTALPLHSCPLSLPAAFLSFHSCSPWAGTARWAKLHLMLLPIMLISVQGKLDPDPGFLEMKISTHSFPKEVYSEPVCCWIEHFFKLLPLAASMAV